MMRSATVRIIGRSVPSARPSHPHFERGNARLRDELVPNAGVAERNYTGAARRGGCGDSVPKPEVIQMVTERIRNEKSAWQKHRAVNAHPTQSAGKRVCRLRSRWLLACIACVSRETRCDSRCFKMSERIANMKSWDPFKPQGMPDRR
jgi:hypothetical protein